MNTVTRLLGRGFVLASVLAVFLPMPRYARNLDHDQYIVWLARFSWVCLLTVGVVGIILLGGLIARRLENKKTKRG